MSHDNEWKQAVLCEMWYFRQEDVDLKAIRGHYERRIYEEKTCAKCEYKEIRFDAATCGECPAYSGKVITWKPRRADDGSDWVGLPRGDIRNYPALGIDLNEYEITDRRGAAEMYMTGFEVTATLKPEQVRIFDEVMSGLQQLSHGGYQEPYGLLEAPPRTGKTLILIAIAAALGLRTLVLANQDDLLKQFIGDLEDHTNIKDVCFTEGWTSYGIAKKVDQLLEYDIALITYQSLANEENGALKLAAIKNSFGLVLVDEAHRAAANDFSRVVNAINSWYKIGCTATPKRKDGMDFRIRQILGPVIAKAKQEAMQPYVTVHFTGCKPTKLLSHWTRAMKWLSEQEDREDYIISLIEKDVNLLGHYVVVPVVFKAQAWRMVEKLVALGITAESFTAETNREDLLRRAKAGEIQVVIGIRSILSTGVNVPPWSSIHEISPIANSPNLYQEYNRVCTEMTDADYQRICGKKTGLTSKPQPVIRMYVDEMGQSTGCFAVCWKDLARFARDERTKARASRALSMRKSKKGRSVSDDFAGTDESKYNRDDSNQIIKSRFDRGR